MFRLDLAEALHKTFAEINKITVMELKLWAARANIKNADTDR